MDRCDHSPPWISQSVEELHQVESGGWVQASCGLIEENQWRINEQLHSDWGPFFLASGQPSNETVTNIGFWTFLQPQRIDHTLNDGNFFLFRFEGQSHIRNKLESLSWCERWQHEILLHNITNHSLVVQHSIYFLAVDHDVSSESQILGEKSTREQIKHRSFSGAGGTKDSSHRFRLKLSRALL